MTTSRKRPILYLLMALIGAFVAFYGLFEPGLDRALAWGLLLLGLVGFVVFFNRGYDLLRAGRNLRDVQR